MAAKRAVAGPRWALPPQPPEAWFGGVWSAVVLVSLAIAVGLPLLGLPDDASTRDITLTAMTAAAGGAGVAAAYALLVEHSVRGAARLRWVALGYAVASAVLVLRSAADDRTWDGLDGLVLAAVPVFAATCLAARRFVLAAAPAAVLLGAAAAVLALRDDLPDLSGGVAWAGVVALAVLGLLVWRGRNGPFAWVSVTLVLGAVAAGARILAGEAYDDLWWASVGLGTAAFVVPGLALGLGAFWGFGRQSRRWRQLETDVRALRAASPLLPGRSVTPDDDEGLPGRTEVEVLIEAGLVKVAIQPVVELATGRVVGHEALSRFGGRVPTDRWFKAASKYELGGLLERVTLQEALSLLPNLPATEFLAVNISPAALADREVMKLLDDADLSRVVVEITEHEAVGDYRTTRATLGRLRRRGARIAVDDTGAGFASLRHVLMLQPDLIKLDTSLTRGIETDKRQQALVRAVNVFAHQVGAIVLAEGIETQGQLDALRAIGVPLGQGWHLGVPALAT